ncbi:MAG: hypothetical protein K8T25_17475 [Planctomycetia bacterium]|nr:hypothetical protein [Planctomycetia bacterium]
MSDFALIWDCGRCRKRTVKAMEIKNTTKCASALSSAAIGAVCGALLAALCSTISGSTFAMGATLLVVTLLGAWLGRFNDFVMCVLCAPLVVALAAVLGSTPLGVVSTIAVCALFGRWRGWMEATANDSLRNHRMQSHSFQMSEMRIAKFSKELTV